MSFFDTIRELSAKVHNKVNTCPPMDPPSRQEVQAIIPLIQDAKKYMVSRGEKGNLKAFDDCRVYNVLQLKKEDIPQNPAGWVNWFLTTEQKLLQSVNFQQKLNYF